ncbi:MAG: asparagine synthase-related protein, partial [Desulfovibrionaceae bacterium]
DPDDLRYSRLLADALGIRLVEVPARLDEAETWAAYRDILAHFEVPVYLGLVVLPGYLVCRRMAEDGVRVALDGTGGDEVLGGYPGYFQLALENSMRAGKVAQAFRLKRMVDQRASLRSHGFVSGWLRFLRRTAFPHRRPREAQITDSRAAFFARYARCADAAGLEGIIRECFWRDRLTEVEAMQEYDLKKGQMPTYLYINDQVSMIHSVETRSPLMDYRLYKYLRLPLDLKFRDGFNKYLLRKALPASVPDAVRWRAAKAGFALKSPDIFAARRGEMEACVRASALLGDLFDMDALLSGLAPLAGRSHFKELLEHLYSVALLETLVPMRA